MNDNLPVDSWELAELLEKIAKLLKSHPRFNLDQSAIFKEWKKKEAIQRLESLNESKYQEMTINELKKLCRKRKISGYSRLRKKELIQLLIEHDKKMTTIDKISTAFASTEKVSQ